MTYKEEKIISVEDDFDFTPKEEQKRSQTIVHNDLLDLDFTSPVVPVEAPKPIIPK